METLKDRLDSFANQIDDTIQEEKLQVLFESLALGFLYGGYIQVRNEYNVYIKTVEFYFHSEKPNGIHDPIVYHRNGKNLDPVPYFPLMTLHAHNSGFDITFENKDKEYRASALIRAYEVKDKNGQYLVWDTKKGMFTAMKEYGYNTQSTYLYFLLNGFSLGECNAIKWHDEVRVQSKNLSSRTRQNVFQSEYGFEYQKIEGKKCERKWSFTREEP